MLDRDESEPLAQVLRDLLKIPLVAFRLLFGVFTGVLTVAGNVHIAAAVSRDFRGRAFGVQSALSPLGSMAGPLLGGYVGDTLGLSSAFYASSLVFVLASGILLFYMRGPVAHCANDS